MPETKTITESSMYHALPLKPTEHIENIINKLKPNSNIYETKCRQIINYKSNNSHQCYLLMNGTIAIFRLRDGFMLNSEVAPFIFGLSNQLTDSEYLFMRSEECSTIAAIPLEKANEIIANENLWESWQSYWFIPLGAFTTTALAFQPRHPMTLFDHNFMN